MTAKAQAGVSRVAFDILLLVQSSEQRWILPAVAGGSSVSSFLPYLLILAMVSGLEIKERQRTTIIGAFLPISCRRKADVILSTAIHWLTSL